MSDFPFCVVLAGGGTGGHVIPAIALGEEIVKRGGQAHFVGTSDRLEAQLVPKAGFDIEFIHVRPLKGGGGRQVLLGLMSVPMAVSQSIRVLKKLKPNVVLGVGGYVAGPVVLAARLMGIPRALLEQNAAVGLTNKLLGRVVDRAFVSYEETLLEFKKEKAVLTGNPIRRSVLNAAESRQKKESDGTVRIVVMGGSQGARAIDERVPKAMALTGLKDEIEVFHQSSGQSRNEVVAAYQNAGIKAEVVLFIEDMGAAYLAADLVIARSGATTLSELQAMGLPAILLPYPHHKDRQQERNAMPMKNVGAAAVLDENQKDVSIMAASIAKLVRDKAHRQKAAKAALSLSRPDAAKRVVDGLFEIAGGSS